MIGIGGFDLFVNRIVGIGRDIAIPIGFASDITIGIITSFGDIAQSIFYLNDTIKGIICIRSYIAISIG